MTEFRYKAFISYSHQDRGLAEWIHRGLEAYRVPRRLVGSRGEHGEIDRRLRPVFMDSHDLGAAHSLDHELRQALEASEFLIVLCSPAAVQSRWIDEEIRLFAEMGRWHKVLAVIIDGDPEVHDGPTACFPKALYQAPDGREHEPLASDMRTGADGRRLGLQKLIAGLLGVPLDVLRRREHQRTLRRRALLGVAAAALAAVGLFSLFSWNESTQRRDSGETLVTMKLNELRTVLDVEEDPESLPRLVNFDAEARQWARGIVEQADAPGLEASRLIDDEGIPAWESGDLATAMEHFRRAWLLNALLLQSNPDDPNAFFQLGQAEFWIGRVHYDRAELDEAERAFMAYAEITRRLVRSEPDNPEWVLEMAYALTNLGYLESDRGGNPERVLQVMQSALEYNQIALVLDPGNPTYAGELGQSLANLASAQMEVCDISGALATTEESVGHELALFNAQRDNLDHQWNLAAALGKRAAIHASLGDGARSARDLSQSLDLLQALSSAFPDDLEIQNLILDRKARLLREQGFAGQAGVAADAFEPELESWQAILDDQQVVAPRFFGDLMASRLSRAELLLLSDRREEAITELRRANEVAAAYSEQVPASGSTTELLLVKSAFLAWHLGSAGAALSPQGWDLAQVAVDSPRSCNGLLSGLRLALMHGERESAESLARQLDDQDFADPSYTWICSNYSVCDVR